MEPIINRTDASVPARQVPPPPPKESGAPSAPPPAGQVSSLSALAKKAASGPDLRADAIERGKRLVADPNYPSDKILEDLAEGLLGSDDFRSGL